jgi:protein O-GlcNAc transferase
MSTICDWRGGRGSTGGQPIIDEQLRITFRDEGDRIPRGWMGKLENVTKEQLLEGYKVGKGIMKAFGELKEWSAIVQLAHGETMLDSQRRYVNSTSLIAILTDSSHWETVLGRFYGSFNRYEKAMNETGFVIRLIEMLNRITQQRWYGDHYVQNSSEKSKPSKMYGRFRLPGAMESPPVPSVLPFHTV